MDFVESRIDAWLLTDAGRELAREALAESAMRVLVTGAGRGLGRAFALAFAGQGDEVAAADLDAAAAAETAALAGGGAIGVAPRRRGRRVRARRPSAPVVAELGGIDVLVNNAGLYAGLRARRRSTSSPRASGTA